MKLAIIGAGNIKDSFLFDSYVRKAIKFFKEPIDYIVVDSGSSKGIRLLAEDFADEHGIEVIACETQQVASEADGLFIIWTGRHGKREEYVFYETRRMLKGIYEVRLEKKDVVIGEHNSWRCLGPKIP